VVPLIRVFQLTFILAFLSTSFTWSASDSTPTVVFMSDFGVIDDSVAICKGVMLGIEPDLRIIDLTHQVTPYSVMDAARFLAGTSPYYPAGTIFLVVVDPGVGSLRKAIVVRSAKKQYFVVPDNGLMTLVLKRDGLDGAREITNEKWMIGAALSSTFHGRDIFSPVAAHLAKGDDWTSVGPLLEHLVELKLDLPKEDGRGLTGEIIGTDGPFGNLISNIQSTDFSKLAYQVGDRVTVIIGGSKFSLPFVKTFSDVALKRPLLYIDSRGRVAMAINQGNFAQTFHVKPPVPIIILRNKSSERSNNSKMQSLQKTSDPLLGIVTSR
jgi:S-adenosylmethionine hydrolase